MPGKPRKSRDRRSAVRAALLTVPLVTGVLGGCVAQRR